METDTPDMQDGTNGTGTGPAPPGPLTVKDAALYLGIGERAVRKRIAAGTLQADHIDGIWRVWPYVEPDNGTNGTGTGPEQGRGSTEPRNRAAEPPAEPSQALAVMDHLVSPLVAELGAARQRIEDLARENGRLQAELDALHAQADAQPASAPPAVPVGPEPTPTPSARPTPSWRARALRWLRP